MSGELIDQQVPGGAQRLGRIVFGAPSQDNLETTSKPTHSTLLRMVEALDQFGHVPSGALAPDVIPSTRTPSSHSSSTSV